MDLLIRTVLLLATTLPPATQADLPEKRAITERPWWDPWFEQYNRPRRMPRPTTQEVSELEAFALRYTPERWATLQTLPEPERDRLLGMMVMRYRQLEHLKDRDPELYNFRLRRMQVEDQVFIRRRDLELAQKQGEMERRRADFLLREALRVQVGMSLDERRLRLRRLEERLRREQERLREDDSRVDELMEQRFQMVTKFEPQWMLEGDPEAPQDGPPGPPPDGGGPPGERRPMRDRRGGERGEPPPPGPRGFGPPRGGPDGPPPPDTVGDDLPPPP